MDCKDVRKKLKDYIEGRVNDSENDVISEHLAECSACMKELESLDKTEEAQRVLGDSYKKAKNRLYKTIAVIAILAVIALYLFNFVLTRISIEAGKIVYNSMPKYSRAFSDAVQFSSPVNVGGYGNSYDNGIHFYTKLKAFTHQVVGTKSIEYYDAETKLSFFGRGIENHIGGTTSFIHPDITPEDEALVNQTIGNAKKILEKNTGSTVATISVSLDNFITMDDVKSLISDYDISIFWMAVECGHEKDQAKNMSNGLNQYIQWGIPGNLFVLDKSKINIVEMNEDNFDEYFKAVIDELTWIDKNKNLIKPDSSLLKNNGIDSSIKDKAAYVLENGFKIYGLRITGPTDELVRLQQALNIRYESVDYIDFWYWK